MSHHIITKPWVLITNVSSVKGYLYLKHEVNEHIDCSHDYVINEYDTEEELATAVDALEEDGFYMNPENRIPADTMEEQMQREEDWHNQQNAG